MIDVRISGESLDLSEDTSLSYTLNNSVFTSTDTSQLPGSYSFPFTVPNTGKNQRILKHPGLINSAEQFDNDTAEIYFTGVLLFIGTLTIESANEKSISLYVVSTQITDLKSIKLTNMVLGGVREIGNEATMLAHAKATAENPMDYDYIFCPVQNFEFITGKLTFWQNYWDIETGVFVVNNERNMFMPFVRIDYLLDQIFAQTNYVFRNEFQITDELKMLIQYSNYSMHSKSGLASSITLSNHLPDISCADYVKQLSSVFCLGIFTNIYSKVIRLVPLQRVLAAPYTHNWTNRVHHEYTINREKAEVPLQFRYEEDENDTVFRWLRTLRKPEVFTVVQTMDDIMATPGTYYVVSRHQYWEYTTELKLLYTTFGIVPELTEEALKSRKEIPQVTPKMQPLMDGPYEKLPIILQPGTVEYYNGLDDDDQPIWVDQRSEMPNRFTIYRGIQYNEFALSYPLASGLPYDPLGATIGSVSLRWDDIYGVYDTWWSAWHQMLLYGKHVTRRFNLTPADLVSFNFDEKVRVDNMDYFIKSIRVNLTMQRMMPVDVEMVSVI